MKTLAEQKYTEKLSLPEDVYATVTAFIGRERLHRRMKIDGDLTYYFLDEWDTQIIRTNREARTIEIGENVESEIIDAIDHVMMMEMMKGKGNGEESDSITIEVERRR